MRFDVRRYDVLDLPAAPHLESSVRAEDDVALDKFETRRCLSNRLVVQEKIEGYGLACYFVHGKAVIRHKGKQVTYPVYRDGFREWIGDRESIMGDAIGDRLVIFGSWAKKASYTNIPDLFLVHDIFDRQHNLFWASPRIEHFCRILGISMVPKVWEGILSIGSAVKMAEAKVKYGRRPNGAIYMRYEDDFRVLERAQFQIPNTGA
jgi:hypothetical protein